MHFRIIYHLTEQGNYACWFQQMEFILWEANSESEAIDIGMKMLKDVLTDMINSSHSRENFDIKSELA